MDLGSTVCTPKKVTCNLCPLSNKCGTFKAGLQDELPLPKPRKTKEHWVYVVYKNTLKKNQLLIKPSAEMNAPVLKKSIMPDGVFKKVEAKPQRFAFMHTVTNHNIYVKFENQPKKTTRPKPKSKKLEDC